MCKSQYIGNIIVTAIEMRNALHIDENKSSFFSRKKSYYFSSIVFASFFFHLTCEFSFLAHSL